VNDHQLAQFLNEQSPWRARDQWEADDPDLRAAARLALDYEPEPLADIRAPGLYVFRGPRRVGKSLELKRAIARLLHQGVNARTVLYCSCDGLSKQELRRLIIQGHNISRTLPGPRYWFLDEVTAVRGWSDVIKQLRDQHTEFRESCVVLTGSSARDLEEARKDLADRRGGIADSDRLLLPMGFRSFCVALGLSGLPDPTLRPKDFMEPVGERAIHELEPWTGTLDDHWRLFLEVGGFPRAVGEYVGTGAVSEGFIQGLWDVVAGDAIRAATLSDADVMALLDRLVVNLASPVNATSISDDVGLSGHQAAMDRINDLVSAFLAWRCYRIKAGRPNPASQRKLYFVDPLIAQLAHRRNESYPAPDPSKLNEQQVGLALARAVSFKNPAAFVQSDRVMYERTETEAEIDFVGPELEVPFECKYTDAKWKQEALTLKARYGRGVMATRLPLVVGEHEPVWAVPSAIVAWLLGD
jgi:predicted AAA+ superfamily ATPase